MAVRMILRRAVQILGAIFGVYAGTALDASADVIFYTYQSTCPVGCQGLGLATDGAVAGQ